MLINPPPPPLRTIWSLGSGSPNDVTAVATQVKFGSTNVQIVLNEPGGAQYSVGGSVNLAYNGATFAANRTLTLTLSRLNNTPQDLVSRQFKTDICTTRTEAWLCIQIPEHAILTTNANDIIGMNISLDVVPTAGSIQITAAKIVGRVVARPPF